MGWIHPPLEIANLSDRQDDTQFPSAGDVNGDGFDDIIIGNVVYFGRTYGIETSPSQILPQDNIYNSAIVGDLNDDGFADAIMVDFDGQDVVVRVFYGDIIGLIAAGTFVVEEDIAYVFYSRIQGLGDINGDGFGDVAFSLLHSASLNNACASRVWIHYGSGAGISSTPGVEYHGDGSNCLGSWIDAGDFNGDGYNDLVLSAPWNPEGPLAYRRRGRIFAYHGGPQGLASTADWVMALSLPPEAQFVLGQSLAVGDLNGDGYDDLVTQGGVDAEKDPFVYRDYAFFGGAQGLGSAWLSKDLSDEAGGRQFTTYLGDIDGDGHDDFLRPTLGEFQGVYLGLFDWTNGVFGYELGPEFFWIRWAAAGDLNADGFDDWVGATYSDTPPKLYVFFGRANPAPTADTQSVSLLENTTVDIVLTGADPYGDALHFGIERQPAHGRISGFSESTGELQYIPDFNFAGSDSFEFAVMDPFGGKGTAEVLIEVGRENHAPVFIAPTPTDVVEIYADRELRLIVRAQDDDLDPITYSVTGQPWNARFNAETGATYWTPDNTQLGPHVWTFTATDGTDSVSQTVVLRVLEAVDEEIFDPTPDIGMPDAGDAGSDSPEEPLAGADSGCGCNQSGGPSFMFGCFALVFLARRKKERK